MVLVLSKFNRTGIILLGRYGSADFEIGLDINAKVRCFCNFCYGGKVLTLDKVCVQVH